MVLRFLIPALAFFFISCGDPERNNPDDPHGINYQGNQQVVDPSSSSTLPSNGSSSSVTRSSSSLKVSSSSAVIVIYDCPLNGDTVKIGEQVWMKENLNCDVSGSKCYNNDQNNCLIYGRLYNWATAQTVCPSGWHLPSIDDWNTLASTAGGAPTAGMKLKAQNGWSGCDSPGSGGCNDDLGFTALPGGAVWDGNFKNVDWGYWWSSSEDDSNMAYAYDMGPSAANLDHFSTNKSDMYSVRCVMD